MVIKTLSKNLQMPFTKKILSIALLIISTLSYSQDDNVSSILVKKYAENSFQDNDFEFALENYLIMYRTDKQNVDINYRIGICYTETNVDKAKAIPYLEYVVSHNNFPVRAFYYLGRAYMYNYRFTEAVEALYEFKMIGIDEAYLLEADRLISKCYNALEYINQPVNVTFELLDTTINTPYDDFNPFISPDGLSMYFTSRKTYVKDFEDYISNVFYSSINKKDGKWESTISLPTNTYDNEEITGITPLADKITIYADGDYSTHDIKIISKNKTKFTDITSEAIPNINTEGLEPAGCFTADGNTFIFSSDRKGGRGGLDLYIMKKDIISGLWSEPENMGTTINSEYDENFPNISDDSKKLYFASQGHSGIGGYDFFVSNYSTDMAVWSTPRNLGFPINTPLDNTTISFEADGKTAYIADNRKEGIGNLDIYKLKFGAEEIQPKILMGTVLVKTNRGEVPYSEDFLMAYATIYDMHGNIYAQYEVQSDGGQFFATIYPGTYKLEVNFSGKSGGFSKSITVSNEDEFLTETVVLNNLE